MSRVPFHVACGHLKLIVHLLSLHMCVLIFARIKRAFAAASSSRGLACSGMILAGAYIWIIKQYGEITLLDHIPW